MIVFVFLFNFYNCPSNICDSGWLKIIKNNSKNKKQNIKQKLKIHFFLKTIFKNHIKNAQIYLGTKYNPLFTFSTAIE